MFSALSQGSLIHILEKTDGLKYKVGEVIGVTQPQVGNIFSAPSYTNPNSLITIKVKVDGAIKEYPEVVPTQSTMSYNNGALVISETVQGIQVIVENTHKHNKQILANKELYEKEIVDCENIMKELNPQFAKDKERDDRINGLDSKVTSMEGKLDKILNALTNGSNNSTLKL